MDIHAMLDASKGVLAITKDIAWSFVLLLFVIQVVLTLTKGVGGEKIEHAVSLQGLLMVGMLLVFYDQMTNWVISISNSVLEQIVPADFVKHLDKSITDAIDAYKKANPDDSNSYGGLLGYALFGNNSIPVWILSVAVVFMKVSFLIISYLSNIVKNFLIIIGPLAIVTRIIPGASVLKGWIKSFVEVAFWPILSGIFFQMVSAGAKGIVTTSDAEIYFKLLAMCVIIALLNLFTPLIVNALSNNQGIGVAASWVAGGASIALTKGLKTAKSKGSGFVQGLKDGYNNKERRPGDDS